MDPLARYNPVLETEFYGDGQHNGGDFNNGNLNGYSYTYQNPIRFVDPNGKQSDVAEKPIAQATRELTKSHIDDASKLVLDTGKGAAKNPRSWVLGLRQGILGILIQSTLSTSHTPDFEDQPTRMSSFWDSGLDTKDVKSFGKEFRSKDSREKKVGSYTITYLNGKKYHGKGPITRVILSALRYMPLSGNVKSMDWAPATNEREAYKQEYRRMQTDATYNNETNRSYDEGYQNPINHNIIQSKGKEYIKQDGF